MTAQVTVVVHEAPVPWWGWFVIAIFLASFIFVALCFLDIALDFRLSDLFRRRENRLHNVKGRA